MGPPPAPAPLPSVPRLRPCPEPSRVETVKRLLRKSGLSRRASRQLSRCVRDSTARLYQSQWLSFCGWCRGRSITPIDATIPMIVDFLIHLREDKCFSLSALKGYRSTINSVFTLKGMDLTNSKELSMLFRSFAKTCSPQDLRPPAWDVALVLQSLTNLPYEPIREAEERFLAQKTLPDSLGLGQASRGTPRLVLPRISCHGLEGGVFQFCSRLCGQNSRPVLFRSAVRELHGTGPTKVEQVSKRKTSVYGASGQTLPRPHRPRCERLFITSGRTKKEISKNTVSFWLRKAISLAYQLSGKPLPSPSPPS